MNKKKNFETILYSTVGVVAMLVLVIALNVVGSFVKVRADLTAEKAYTLSAGTKAILKKLDTPVKLRFYCTQDDNNMPVPLKSYARRIEDLLSEYRQLSNGKIIIQKLDPQPDSDAEESAAMDGIEGQMIAVGERIYLGLAVSCLDAKVPISGLLPDRERLLEYDITRAISQVIAAKKPVIGVMSGLPVFGAPQNPMMMMRGGGQASEPWVFIGELKRDYTVRQVEMNTDKIDDDIKTMVVVYPKDISDTAQFALDQFVLRGGKLIAFLDPLSIVDNRAGGMNALQRAASSGATMDKLLKGWGLEFDMSKVVMDRTFMTQINRGGRAEAAPTVLSMTPEGLSTNDVATAQIDTMLLPFSGVFTGTPAAGLKQDVLIRTSEKSQLIEKMMAEFGGESAAKDFVPSGKQYALAVRLSGKFKTAFPDGKPAAKPDPANKDAAPEPKGDVLKESKTDGYVVLVGDSDMIYDQFCVQVQNFFGQKIVTPQNGNLTLLQNMVDQMSGDSDLIGLRSRAVSTRPFTVVKRMQAEAEDRFRAKIKEVESSLQVTQQRLNELQQSKDKSQKFIMSPEQQQELANFRKKEAEAKRELKEVRKSLRKEIDSLENRLKWINIAAMPFLVTLSGVALAVVKRKKTAAK